jgi:predicted RNA-binding Zn ribbon-like protein
VKVHNSSLLAPALSDLPLLGGRLCLDFANTIDPRYGDAQVEYLPDYSALVDWGIHIGTTSPTQAEAMLKAAGSVPLEAQSVHLRAIALREDIYTLLRPVRASDSSRALARFNSELKRHSRHTMVTTEGPGYAHSFEFDADLDQVLWPVARNAAELMTNARELSRVHECEGVNCGWLFLDTSKAGRRRWCSMDICGNRAKVARHRNRQASASSHLS